MSKQQPKSRKIGEVVNRLEELYPRQVGPNQYRVLSTRNGTITAHAVHTAEITCTCEDMQYNQDGHSVCDHIAVALYEAPKRMDFEEQVLDDVVELSQQAIQGTHGGAEDTTSDAQDQTTDDTQPDSQASQETQATGNGPDLVGLADDVEDFLEMHMSSTDPLDIWVGSHGGASGVCVEPVYYRMEGDQKEDFEQAIKLIDSRETHVGIADEGCDTCGKEDGDYWFHIPASAKDEVPGHD